MEIATDEINVTKSKVFSLDTRCKTDEKKETDNVLSSFEEALLDDLLDAVKNELSHDRDKNLQNKHTTDINKGIVTDDSAKTTSTKDHAVIESGEANGETTQEGQTNNDIEPTGQENALKRKKRARCRPPKRRRLAQKEALIKDEETKETNAEIVNSAEQTIDTLSGDVEYCLTVTNLPNSWSFMDIKNYVDLQCGPVDEIEMVKDDDTGIGAIRLSYQVKEDCETAMTKLADKQIEGNKLTVSMSVVDLSDSEMLPETPPVVESNPETTDNPENVTQPTNVTTQQTVAEQETLNKEQETPAITTPWKPDLYMWEIDPNGTYGLKERFLKSVGITPPLDKWVHVSNFRCDKSDIREAMEMAGGVVMCSVYQTTHEPKYANVMYSHPLEAVQAVTLLNGQNLHEKPLKVVMDRCPVNTVFLPKGLNNIGRGLGANGKPQRSIIEHYHRYVTNQSSSINLEAFEEIPKNNHLIIDESFQVKRIEEFNNNVVSKSKVKKVPVTKSLQPKQKPIPTMATSPVRIQGPQNFGPRNGPSFGQFGPRPAWNGPGPGHGPRPNWNGPGPMRPPGPMGGPMHGPRPMGPMGGPMQGPMGGPMQGSMGGPMSGPMPGPMQGPMPGPMQGPMSGPMQSPMQRPMQGNIQGPMQGNMQGPLQGTMQGPMQGKMQGPMQGTMQGPMQGTMQGSMQGTMQGPMQGTMQGPMQGTMQAPMQASMQAPMQGTMQGHMQGTMQAPMQASMQAPMQGTMQGPMQGTMQSPMQGPTMTPMQNPAGHMFDPNQPVQLQLSNLPPSTTFAILCEKMAACGQVVSIQLTTPGSAVVTFANKMQADYCYTSYNNMCVEGYYIQVKYTS